MADTATRDRRLLVVTRVLWVAALLGVGTALPAIGVEDGARPLALASLGAVTALWAAYTAVWALARRGRFEPARRVLFASWVAYIGVHLGMYDPRVGPPLFGILFVGLANALVAMMSMGLLALATRGTVGRWLAALLGAYVVAAALAAARFEDPDGFQTFVVTAGLSAVLLAVAAGFASVFTRDLESAVARGEALRRDLEHALDDAREANAAKSRFLANMSHELRTPLTGIVGYAELILESTAPSPRELARDVDRIRSAALHLHGVIGDVLDLSKIEAGKLELESSVVDLRALIDEVADTARPIAAARSNELVVSTTRLPRAVRTDPGRLRQVLLNLLSNAAKFTERGVVTLLVEGWADGIRFVVSDTGIGIPEDKLESIFQPFEQVDASTTRRYGGTGLGLSVTRQLLRLMGSELVVRSRLGEGSTFEFALAAGRVDLPEDLRAAG